MIKDVTAVYGYQQIVAPTVSTALTIPTRSSQTGIAGTPTVAIIAVESQGIRWRDDGVAPTASVGMPVAPGAVLIYDGDLTRFRFIQTAGSATVNVSYYK